MLMLLAIIAITVVSVLYVWPGWPKRYLPDFIDYPEGPGLDLGRDAIRLGLDLQGGTYVLVEADTAALPPGTDVDDALEGAKEIIKRRVDALGGVAETEVTREGKNRLAVQLPGVGREEAAALIGKTALLEFREPVIDDQNLVVCDTLSGTGVFSVPGSQVNDGFCIGVDTEGTSVTGLAQWIPATARDSQGDVRVLTGAFVSPGGAESLVLQGAQCTPACVLLDFTGEGSLLFEEITGRLVNFPLAIFLDEELIGAPNVASAIAGDSGVIGGLQRDEAETLAIQINAGSLPVPLNEIATEEIEATLGEETLVRGVQAGIIGVLAVMFFMVMYYRLPGFLASLALVTYTSVVMLVIKIDDPIIGAITVTLPGIAGFVLSVGMAVDGNILVFERMKEELRGGRALGAAVERGFDRAWSSIRDSNVATLITCVILFWFGDQFGADPVRAFAITLAIGVVISMLSAIIVTRTLLRAAVASPLSRNLNLFVANLEKDEPVKAPARKTFAVDFVRRRGLYFLISAVVLLPGVISLAVPPALEAGIDFTSGATFTVAFEDTNVDADDVRDALGDIGHDEARVQKTQDGEFIVRMSALESAGGPPVGPAPPGDIDEIQNELISRFGPIGSVDDDDGFADLGRFTNFNQVSEIISQEIVVEAAIAIGFVAFAILVYLMWTFRKIPNSHRYGIAAIVAAAHDALFILGMFSLFGKVFGMEVNREFIAAILTVIGFSVHDTIVVFDRLREKINDHPDVPFAELVNASLSETIARSINTSTTVMFTVIALLLLGTGQINGLLIAFLLGVIAGTYSSIFIAAQLLVSWEDGDFQRLFRRIIPGRARPAPAPETS